MKRPKILNIKTGDELKKWYWLKSELVALAKTIGISYTGAKFEILDRIATRLDGKNVISISKQSKKSNFNWSKDLLTLDTIITDSYTNGPNTRAFFKSHCGEKFHFSIPFMNWMRENQGKKLKDAVTEWKRLEKLSKNPNFKSEIPAGNQYNKYIRDIFTDNPTMTIEEARYFWKLKRSLPLGRHIYEPSDLKLKSK
jgi:hypothetical protein